MPQQSTTRLFHLIALFLALYVYCQADPFYIPTIDDSAIIMRYLRNFQSGCFYCYNVADGPVYGISDFWYGLSTGFLSWLGLAPQAALMTISLLTCIFFFSAVFRIFYHASGRTWLALGLGAMFYFSSRFIPMNLFAGLETPLHLWLIATTFLFLLEDRPRLFFLLAGASIVSKLDSAFLVAFMLALHLLRARLQGMLRAAIRDGALYFILPLVAWMAFATWVFGSPIPQSFLAKMLLRQHAPATSWFPFIEPMIDDPRAARSMALALACGILAVIVAWGRRLLFTPSLIFAAASVGTLALYFVFNPGEKEPWYYALPEFLILMTVFLLPIDAFRLPRRTLAGAGLVLSSLLALAVLYLRFPMNRGSFAASRQWSEVFEQERMDTGLLANKVAPKDHPVLWTGHGYPAYVFDGYVVDSSGLNTRAIWKAIKAVSNPIDTTRAFLLSLDKNPADFKTLDQRAFLAQFEMIQMFKANVFMQHEIFEEPVQKGLGLRLAGSFYVIDLVGAPAFRVFVADPQHAELNHAIPIRDVQTQGGETARQTFYADGQSFSFSLPPRTARLQFGAYQNPGPFTVTISAADSGQAIAQCDVPTNPHPLLPQAVFPCVVDVPVTPGPLTIRMTDDGAKMRIFEPVATEYLATPSSSRLAQK